MKRTAVLALAALSSLSAGCSSVGSKPLSESGSAWMYYAPDKRGAIVERRTAATDPSLRSLSEPPPDVAVARTMDFLAKVGLENVNVEAKASLAEKLTVLAHRSERVELLRDACFRLAEASFNGSVRAEDYAKTLSGIIDRLASMAATDALSEGIAAVREMSEANAKSLAASQNLFDGQVKANAISVEASRNHLLQLLLDSQKSQTATTDSLARTVSAFQEQMKRMP